MIRKAVSLVLVGTLLGPAVASARGSKNKEQARALYKEGKAQFNRQAYSAAVESFKRSHALYPHRNTLYNIALSLAHNGDHKAAFRYLGRYLKRATPRDPPLDVLLRRVRKRYGVLHVVVPDSRTSIYVDGRRVGRGKVQLILPAGTRALDVRQNDRVVARKMLELPGGRVVYWELGAVEVVGAHSQDKIFVDGMLLEQGRVTQVVDVGSHVVLLRRGRKSKARKVLRVAAGQTAVWTLTPLNGTNSGLPAPRKGLHWAWITTFTAVTIATAVGATLTSLQTKKIWDEFKNDRTDRSLADRGDRMQLTANVLWGATAVMAAGTALVSIFTRWRKSPEKTKMTLIPMLGPTVAGATLTWRH